MSLFRRRTTTFPRLEDPRLRPAPATVPLWVRPEAAQARRYFAPGTRVHIYESLWHKSIMRPRFAYSVPITVRQDSPLGTVVMVNQRMIFFLDRSLPWIILSVAEDPAPYFPPDVA